MPLKQVIINGEAYVPRKHVEEALDIIVDYSKLCDTMHSNVVSIEAPTREKLDRRWGKVVRAVTVVK